MGLTLKNRGDGRPGVQIAGCKGNAAKAGLKSGDVVKYHSSFFGDELWPADALAFSRSAISACPNTHSSSRAPQREKGKLRLLMKRSPSCCSNEGSRPRRETGPMARNALDALARC